MILLDTCLISELHRPHPNPGVVDWFDTVADHQLFISALTVGEIQRGIDLLDGGVRKSGLRTWLDGLTVAYANRLLAVDTDVCRVWGRISAAAQRVGRPRPVVDALLAATAIQHGLTLATRNEVDFEWTNVPVINPWS